MLFCTHIEHHSKIYDMTFTPKHLDVVKSKGLHIEWANGSTSFLPTHHLRRMSPSADSKAMREELDTNPLAILPKSSDGKLVIDNVQLVGNYAIKITFSDGHATGIYTWEYLRSLTSEEQRAKPDE